MISLIVILGHSLVFGVRLIQMMTWGYWRGVVGSLKTHERLSYFQHSHTISNECSLTDLFLSKTLGCLRALSQAYNISPLAISQESSCSSRKLCLTTATYIALSLFKIPMVSFNVGHVEKTYPKTESYAIITWTSNGTSEAEGSLSLLICKEQRSAQSDYCRVGHWG